MNHPAQVTEPLWRIHGLLIGVHARLQRPRSDYRLIAMATWNQPAGFPWGNWHIIPMHSNARLVEECFSTFGKTP
jgi:hypothetical protein